MGHSLGAATATLVSYAAQAYLNLTLEDSADPVPMLSAVLVAPPNVGDANFTQLFNEGVNARRIAFQYDIVPQAFCATMPACGDPLRGIFQVGACASAQPATGRSASQPLTSLSRVQNFTVVPTNNNGTVSSWSYSQIGGNLTIPGTGMPQVQSLPPSQPPPGKSWLFDGSSRSFLAPPPSSCRRVSQDESAWPALADLELCYATDFLAATHVCSYKCFLSQFAGYEDALQQSNCWLSSDPVGEGSLCPFGGWPLAYPGM